MGLPSLAKLRYYREELRTAAWLAADWRSALRLGANTLRFHLRNAVARGAPDADEAAVPYRVRLGREATTLWLRTYCGDLFVLHEVFVTACYAIPPGLARPVRSVVDLGANVGLTTLFYAQRFPDARFVCVEPDPGNARLLRDNVACLGDRALVIEGAISDRAGSARFEERGWSWGRQLARDGRSGLPVRCLTMDDVVAAADLPAIDLLKVDVEDGVEALFRGGGDWLRRVETIVVELTPGYPIERFERDVGPYGLEALPAGSPHGNRMVMAVRREAWQGTQEAPAPHGLWSP